MKERVATLEGENRDLKSRLRDLRRAAAATTKIVKAPTTFVDLKKEESGIKCVTLHHPYPSLLPQCHVAVSTRMPVVVREISSINKNHLL